MKRIPRLFAIGLIALFWLGSESLPVTGGPARTDEQTIMDDFATAMTMIEEHYADRVNYEDVTKMAILGMLHTLDPHSNYYDKREFARFRLEQTSQYFGIGATIGARNGKVFILAPFPNTPAYRGGLRYGDQIVAINGESAENWPSPQVSARLRGPRGTSVEVQIRRAGEPTPRTVKLTRDAVPLPSISSAYFVRPGIGYINLQRGFNTTTDEELLQHLAQLQAIGLKTLVIDLRNNPGGFLDQAVRMAERFLYQGQVILTQKSRSNKREASKVYESQNADPNLTPLIILVNGGTASASEIVTAAIQEHDRGLVVGEPTFGKALVQTIMSLPFGAGLTLTTAKYLTPSGRLIQRNYSDLSFYDYYVGSRHGARDETSPLQTVTPTGPAFRTESGREFYGDGGITPDFPVPATQITDIQGRLQSVMFAYTRDLVAGLIPGLESYRVSNIQFDHVLTETEYRISDEVMQGLSRFALAHKDEFRLPPAAFEENREFLRNSIRFEVVTAAYGLETAAQVFDEVDLQLLKSIESVQKATDLAKKYQEQTGR